MLYGPRIATIETVTSLHMTSLKTERSRDSQDVMVGSHYLSPFFFYHRFKTKQTKTPKEPQEELSKARGLHPVDSLCARMD